MGDLNGKAVSFHSIKKAIHMINFFQKKKKKKSVSSKKVTTKTNDERKQNLKCNPHVFFPLSTGCRVE